MPPVTRPIKRASVVRVPDKMVWESLMNRQPAAQLAYDFRFVDGGTEIWYEDAVYWRKRLLDRLVKNGVLSREKVRRGDYTAKNNARVRRYLRI